jgi:Kdo2-lipid IVA lauroyltransferase/acyltransferase
MFLLRSISRLPFSVLYGLADFIFVIAYYLVGYRRKMVRQNLVNSFPEKTGEEISQIEKEFYRNLCDYAVETIKLLTLSSEELSRRMRFINPEMFYAYSKQQQSVLILSSHQFNWEWLLASGMLWLQVPVDFVYQPVNNSFFNKFMQSCRTRFGGHAIRRDEVARELARRKNIVRGIAIVADQYPGLKGDKRFELKFLNQDTVFFLGSQQLANLTQYPVLYAEIERVSRGYYTCTFIKVGEPPYDKNSVTVVENYARAVEKVIHNHPSGWLWSHNRWKKRHLAEELS